MAEELHVEAVIDDVVVEGGQGHDVVVEHLRRHDPDGAAVVLRGQSRHDAQDGVLGHGGRDRGRRGGHGCGQALEGIGASADNDVLVDRVADLADDVIHNPVMHGGDCHVLDIGADGQELDIFVGDEVDVADDVGTLGDGAADSAGCGGVVGGGDGETHVCGELADIYLAEQLGGLDQLVPYGVYSQGGDNGTGGSECGALLLAHVTADEVLDPCVAILGGFDAEAVLVHFGNSFRFDLARSRLKIGGAGFLCRLFGGPPGLELGDDGLALGDIGVGLLGECSRVGPLAAELLRNRLSACTQLFAPGEQLLRAHGTEIKHFSLPPVS